MLRQQSLGMRRGRDDGIGPAGVVWCQLRIVSANFGARAFRVQKEIEIVNRDDLRGAPGGDQQRMRRMRDVDVACKHLHVRPLDSMPEVVQE